MAKQQPPMYPLPPAHYVDAANLTPPPIPSNPHIFVFGTPINLNYNEKMAQDEIMLKSKATKLPFQTDIASLRDLNRLLLVKYLDLTKELVQLPNGHEDRIGEINFILVNMQYLLNLYRPHEARETIITMLQKQIARRTLVLDMLKERSAAAETKIEEAKERLHRQIEKYDNERLPTVEDILVDDFPSSQAMDTEVKPNNLSEVSKQNVSSITPTDDRISSGLAFLSSSLDFI